MRNSFLFLVLALLFFASPSYAMRPMDPNAGKDKEWLDCQECLDCTSVNVKHQCAQVNAVPYKLGE